jgi:hypothetical protein
VAALSTDLPTGLLASFIPASASLHANAGLAGGATYTVFQMAEVAVPRELFEHIMRLINGLRRRSAHS